VPRNPKLEALFNLMYLARHDRFGDREKAQKELDLALERLSVDSGMTIDELECYLHSPFMDYKRERNRKGGI
jgi:hypothetical protein